MAELSRDNYVQVSGWMLQDLGLKGNELLIYAIIYGFSQDRKSSYFGDQAYLAAWTNSTVRTVHSSLMKLIGKGLLEVKDIPGPGNRKSYRALWDGATGKNFHLNRKNFPSKVEEISAQQEKFSAPNINTNNNKNDNPMCADGFDRFWAAYPNKKAKDKARKAWEKLQADADLTERIMAALEQQKKSRQWTKDNGEYIPHPATWLNGRRWEDQVTEQKKGYATNDIRQEDMDQLLKDLMEDI